MVSRLERRFDGRTGLSRYRARVEPVGDVAWSIRVVCRYHGNDFGSAVLTGRLTRTPHGCEFDGLSRPGAGALSAQVLLLALSTWVLVVLAPSLLPNANRSGSWWLWLGLVALIGAETAGMALIFYRRTTLLVAGLAQDCVETLKGP